MRRFDAMGVYEVSAFPARIIDKEYTLIVFFYQFIVLIDYDYHFNTVILSFTVRSGQAIILTTTYFLWHTNQATSANARSTTAV